MEYNNDCTCQNETKLAAESVQKRFSLDRQMRSKSNANAPII